MTRSAKVIEVIQVVSLIGEGKEGDPVREIVQYWSKEGRLLASNDFWNGEEHDENK